MADKKAQPEIEEEIEEEDDDDEIEEEIEEEDDDEIEEEDDDDEIEEEIEEEDDDDEIEEDDDDDDEIQDEVEESYNSLRDVIPIFEQQNIRPTRERITEEAVNYIHSQLGVIDDTQASIASIKDQCALLEERIRLLERAKETGNREEVLGMLNQPSSSEDISGNETEEPIKKNFVQLRFLYRTRQRPRFGTFKKRKCKIAQKKSCDLSPDRAGPSSRPDDLFDDDDYETCSSFKTQSSDSEDQ